MTGMTSGEDLTKLDAAQGTEAPKLVKNAEAIQWGKDIAASQTGEIQEMKDLLAAL